MKKTLIKCPCCGTEYLAAEIFYPKDFLGNPSDIIKTDQGVILAYDGEDMNLKEEYVCDKCNAKFITTATVSFKTEQVKDIFDEDEYVSESK